MIFLSVCNSCLQTFEVQLRPEDIELLKLIAHTDGVTAPCPKLCGGRINLSTDDNFSNLADKLKEPISITGRELFQAVEGMGLPDERPKDPWVVEAALCSRRVVSVVIEKHNDRTYLHELRLDDGTTVHLTSGARGARVLKLTKGKADAR